MAKKDQAKAESGERKAGEQTGDQATEQQAQHTGEQADAQQLGATMGLDEAEVGSQKSEGESAASDLRSQATDAPSVSAAPHDETDAEAPVNMRVDAAEPPAVAPAAPRQGDAQRPICRRHHVLMRSYTSSDVATHYRCPVPGCDQTDKRARTAAAPSEPKTCPMRTCQASGEPGSQPQYLEVDERKTSRNPSQIVLVCPKCGFELKTPRPGVFDRIQRVRELQASDDYAAR